LMRARAIRLLSGKSARGFERDVTRAIRTDGAFRDVPQAHRLVGKRRLNGLLDLSHPRGKRKLPERRLDQLDKTEGDD